MERRAELGPDERVYTVSEVTARVKAVLESSLPVFWVEGEVSNFVHHSSGHMYFTLKDDSSQLPAVMFKFNNMRLRFTPENGMKVLVWGRIRVYEPGGRYQLYAERMRPAGVGALALAFEQLKRRLASEGLFDPARKRTIPRLPETVAVVTSPTGAALHDVVRVIRSRCPSVGIVVVPTRVQGREAVSEIVRALDLVDAWGGADVVILTRGGGSLEDLWAFNEEDVARAVSRSRVPVVSAVGHEVDFTIADFVADVRAATPSNAGELVVPDRVELRRNIESLRTRLSNVTVSMVTRLAERVESYRSAYAFRLPAELAERTAQQIDEFVRRLAAAASAKLAAARATCERFTAELTAADPSRILARGFAAVAVLPALRPVRSVSDVAVGSDVRVTVVDGDFNCEVIGVAGDRREP